MNTSSNTTAASRAPAKREIASVEEIVANLGVVEGVSVDQKLQALCSQFTLAARAIDPTISKTWVGYEEGSGDFKRPFYVHLEREDSLFRRPA